MKRSLKTVAVITGAVLLLSGCVASPDPVVPVHPEDQTLHVLAGSEVKDMQPVLEALTAETGIWLDIDYIGTLDGTELVASGKADGVYDATWFPSNRYLSLLEGGNGKIAEANKIMYSPVVLGVKPDVASEFGWDVAAPTWGEIVDTVAAGKFQYGMTSPVSSNSGFSALIEATTALSGTGDALTVETIDSVADTLTTLFEGQNMVSGSSGWLAEKFTENPDLTDGIFNYESVLRSMTVNGEPLDIIIPSDGVITADYPLTLLTSTTEQKEALYDEAVQWLMSDVAQETIADTTLRNTTSNPVDSTTVFELPFPNQLDSVQELISVYLAEIKKPSDMVFTIDTSGSMDGSRLESLKEALRTMTTGDENSFVSFQNREQVTFVEFASDIKAEPSFSFTTQNMDSELNSVNQYINQLSAEGGTAMYSALKEAYLKALQYKKANPDHFISVVLFSDGITQEGLTYTDFMDWYEQQKNNDSGIQTIPAFVIQFGEVNTNEVQSIANVTGGKLFNADDLGLSGAFKEIRGYQ